MYVILFIYHHSFIIHHHHHHSSWIDTPPNASHVKPSMTPFSSSLSRIYRVYAYYILTPVSDQDPANMEGLIETLSSVTIDELPLILPLLNRIRADIRLAPTMEAPVRTFIALWTRIASILHKEQVAMILLPSLLDLLEGSIQMKNFKPLLALCCRTTCGKVFDSVGSKEFLKGLLPLFIEQLYVGGGVDDDSQ